MHLVTGGTGFLGSYVVRDLLAAGEEVTVFDLRPDEQTLSLIAGADALERCRIIRGDVTVAAQVLGAAHAAKPRSIVHLASPLPPDSEWDPTVSLSQMSQGHVNVLEAARHFAVDKIVWASATSVFGRPESHGGPDAVVADDAPHHPETLYGIFKSANERLSALYWSRYRVESIGLRFCQGYGPGKKRGRPFGYQLFEHAVLGKPYTLPYGDDVINWQFVDEMAGIIVRAVRAKKGPARVFNTTGEVITTKQTIGILEKLCPQSRFDAEPGTAGLVWRYDASGLERELGFRTRVGVEDGFARTIATMRQWMKSGVW